MESDTHSLLAEMAIKAFFRIFGDLGTNPVGWIVIFGAPSGVAMLRANRAEKGSRLASIASQWRSEIRDVFIVYLGISIAVFIYEIGWNIPRNIYQEASLSKMDSRVWPIPLPPIPTRLQVNPPPRSLKVSILPEATFLPDGHIGVIPVLQNLSGRTLKTHDNWSFSIGPSPQSPLSRGELEDYLWRGFLAGIKKDQTVFEISTMSDGIVSQKLAMGPFSEDQINQVLAGTLSVYFLKLVTDSATEKHLAEFCVYVKPDKHFGICQKHNMP
jgi:hypothetical protein